MSAEITCELCGNCPQHCKCEYGDWEEAGFCVECDYEEWELKQQEAMRFTIITPGEILKEEFMDPKGLSALALANALWEPVEKLEAVLSNQGAITPELASRLALFFQNSAQFWLKLQHNYDRSRALRNSEGE